MIDFGGLLAIRHPPSAITVFMRKGKGGIMKTLAFPPLAILLGVGFVVVTMLVGVLRQETYFAAAQPLALRAAQNSAAILGAGIAFILLGQGVP